MRIEKNCKPTPGPSSYKLRYIVGFRLVEMAIWTKPTIYHTQYEDTGPDSHNNMKPHQLFTEHLPEITSDLGQSHVSATAGAWPYRVLQ